MKIVNETFEIIKMYKSIKQSTSCENITIGKVTILEQIYQKQIEMI